MINIDLQTQAQALRRGLPRSLPRVPSALQLANTTAKTRRRRQPADVRRKTLSAALRAVHSARLRTSTTHHAAAS